MSREHAAAAWLDGVRARWCAAGVADAVTAGAAVAAAVMVGGSAANGHAGAVRPVAALLGAAVLAAVAIRSWRRWRGARAALAADRAAGLDNLLVTADEIARGGSIAHPRLVEAIWRAVNDRVSQAPPASVAPVVVPVLRAAASLVAAAGLSWALGASPGGGTGPVAATALAATPVAIEAVDVVVIPPAYTGRAPEAASDAAAVQALAGSRIRIDVRASAATVRLTATGAPSVAMAVEEPGHFRGEIVAGQPTAVVLSPASADGRVGQERLLTVGVDPDARPTVRVVTPGRDLLVPDADQAIAVEIEAADDIGLRDVSLSYTKVSGAGEAFSFVEGGVPVDVVSNDGRAWRGRAVLDLSALGLGDGDAIAYRARARDRKPGGAPAVSPSYLVEIGRAGGASSGGFALPKDEARQGLSQQMLILHTEALHAKRTELDANTWTEETRGLAAEQRRVKAEFVFLTGGEVEDEVAEAESSTELAEGRLENSSQVELLTAIRAMSRAEAALNGGDTATALRFEHDGLDALQRAFAKRRYFLRTLPERSRIDAGRRLSGELGEAGSWRRAAPPGDGADIRELAALASALAQAVEGGGPPDAALAARTAASDPGWPELQAAARAMVNRATPAERRQALEEAVRLLAARARASLAAAPAGRLSADPLTGRLADERARARGAPR